MKKLLTMLICLLMVSGLSACSGEENGTDEGGMVYTIGICNYVDDASLNQIVDSIKERLNELSEENGVTIRIKRTP